MNWLDKLERRLGRFAIPNLISYIIVTNAIILALYNLMPSVGISVIDKLSFVPRYVLQGEIWRFITFIFIPPTLELFWGIFALLFYYSIGVSLEQQWGSFRFNIYYLLGMLGTATVSLLFGFTGVPVYLNLSLFLAYAKIFANRQVYLFFILPVKVKYLGWIYWAFLGYTALTGGWGDRILIVVSLANYFLFFGRQNIRALNTKRHVKHRRREFKKDMPKVIYLHQCCVCGVTDRDNPDLEFRYCSKCDGHYEYCADHIFDHEHR